MAIVSRVRGFLEESTFRTTLAFNVLAGRTPIETLKRPWIRSLETPILVDVFDWTTDRLLFSVLVWPPIEVGDRDARYVHRERVEEVTEAIAKGAAEKMWSTYWEVDYGLTWDHERECWIDGDGYAYDGSRLGAGSRRRKVPVKGVDDEEAVSGL